LFFIQERMASDFKGDNAEVDDSDEKGSVGSSAIFDEKGLDTPETGCDTPAASSADGGDRTEHGEDKTERAERKARRKRHKDGAPRFPVYYIKPQMKLLGCKKMTGTVPHMVAGILGCFCDEILAITNEAATAEVRIKKRKEGCMPRLAPSHMQFVKKHKDFETLLSNVHFRKVWQSSSHVASASTPLHWPLPEDPNGLLSCEKQKRPNRIKRPFARAAQRPALVRESTSAAPAALARTAAAAPRVAAASSTIRTPRHTAAVPARSSSKHLR
jgi:hypothetical protein